MIKVQIGNYELTSHIYLLNAIIDTSDMAEVFGFSWVADAVQRSVEQELHTRTSNFEQGEWLLVGSVCQTLISILVAWPVVVHKNLNAEIHTCMMAPYLVSDDYTHWGQGVFARILTRYGLDCTGAVKYTENKSTTSLSTTCRRMFRRVNAVYTTKLLCALGHNKTDICIALCPEKYTVQLLLFF